LLRPLEPRDGVTFLAAVQASTDIHGDWVSPPRDQSAYDAYLARAGSAFVQLGLFRAAAGDLVGVFNIGQIFMGPFCSAYLGYYAFAPFARQGLMREGLDLVLHLAFGPIGLHRLEANVQPANTASIALVRRAGFQREGLSPGYLMVAGAWRDHERWAIRREIWSPRQDVEVDPVA
jgi:ribosomal-protein-alanine N-acetyltransferase